MTVILRIEKVELQGDRIQVSAQVLDGGRAIRSHCMTFDGTVTFAELRQAVIGWAQGVKEATEQVGALQQYVGQEIEL